MYQTVFKRSVYWFVIILILLPGVSVFATSFEQDKKIIIAHAGGGAKNTYLNTLEATLQSIQKGFKYIELDLLKTTDGDLVAAHDWIRFHQLTGYPSQQSPISVTECKKRKILETQTVLTSEEINNIFIQNKDVYLVTDKIRDINLIKEKFPMFLDRIIMEVKFPTECISAQNKGIKYCAFSFDEKYGINEEDSLLVTIPLRDVEKYEGFFLKHPNMQALVYTVNTKDMAQKILNYPFIRGIYTDVLPVTTTKEIK